MIFLILEWIGKILMIVILGVPLTLLALAAIAFDHLRERKA